MAKAGRNEPCSCGSGRKYKHCCLVRQPGSRLARPRPRHQLVLSAEIAAVQEAAAKRRAVLRELGVFILFACEDGDAWLLEMSDSDALQLARGGEPCPLGIDETQDVLEIDWAYRFSVGKDGLALTPYEDRPAATVPLAPVGRIHAAIRRIRRRYPDKILRSVHLPALPPAASE
ncbi:MAG: hypothetical protein BWK76_02365 [Desulfobulbaceae bacterium A2]|nr:MAG: hypothetical protein BWK76_02365 [Desulfobulbaceae bacterium A2]